MEYDVIVVGGGIAGLTSAAYLSKHGYKVLVCEKENKVGGLVNSFNYKGFTFDGGIRALEDSGVVGPMLRQLGIDIEFLKNRVSVGIEDEIINVTSKESLEDYKKMLINKFPQNIKDIEAIVCEIRTIMNYMDMLYGIDNPIFLDLIKDREYFYKTIFPWMFKVMFTINKINKLNVPVEDYLKKFTNNDALIDIISQSFFKNSPSFFALSYFSLYLQYKYPKGGTGMFIKKIEEFILENNGEIKNNTQICSINTQKKTVKDLKGEEYNYKDLIWASDLKTLYNSVDLDSISNESIKKRVVIKKNEMLDKKGGDSVFTLYVTVDLDKSYFEKICTDHTFYTRSKEGLSSINIDEVLMASSEKEDIIRWIKEFFALTTYEIGIPVLRDETLAPQGKTGLIISTLMDYSIVKNIKDSGWYDEFKTISENYIINYLDTSIFKGIKDKVIDRFSSTPLTIESISGNYDGAITGWAFTNDTIPVETKIPNIIKTVKTPIPNIFKAGQWSFSPAGFPISIMTGKLAADKIIKRIKLG